MENIKEKLKNGLIDEAIEELNAYIDKNPHSDEAYYLRGNAWRKKNDFQKAMNNYLAATELNPESPAKQAYDMLMDIMEFYYKDMYNQ